VRTSSGVPHLGKNQAASWYRRGAEAGEPNALPRLAEREETSARSERDEAIRDAQLLRAFSLYAAAAERTNEEACPDDAWIAWRHRRATLARVLGDAGMMRAVAEVYGRILPISISTP
jgi:TPR repeat protein